MPIATPLDDALASATLPEIVVAVRDIANTLWRLQRDLGVAHRDLKPGNLYELDGQILIGDFGLIAVPGAETLTGDGRQVGPAHFTAYEMIVDPMGADPHPADVFSLGKTLWVLATGQRFPPEGHQRADERAFETGQYRPHAGSHALDGEIDRMTLLQPHSRPTKEQVARDLNAWSALAEHPPPLDVSVARQHMLAKIEKALDATETAERYKELARDAVRRLRELTSPLNAQLKSLPGAEIDSMTDALTRNTLKGYFHGRRMIFDWRRCTKVVPLNGPFDLVLRMARAVELIDDGILYLYLLVQVSPREVMGSKFHWRLEPPLSAPVGSIECARMLEEGVQQLADQVEKAVAVLAENLPDLNQPST
jgi:serine/threonine protein kinase